MTARELPTVDPMMVRAFTPTGGREFFGGVLVLDTFDVADVGLADMRLAYDAPVVDCSNRVFQITNIMLLSGDDALALTCFPSRRWRNLREGEFIVGYPDATTPLLYIGNPVRVLKNAQGLHVFGRGEFLIKSGVELGY